MNDVNAFVINLDYQLDRWVSFRKNVQSYFPFNIHHFSPVPLVQCGKEKREIKRREKSNLRSFGEIIKKAKENKWKYVIVFEDDVYLTSKNINIFSNAIKQLPEQFGVCYMGCYIKRTHKKSIKKYSSNLFQLTGKQFRIWGAHAVIFHESVYDLMLEKIFNNNRTIITDRLICDHIINNKKYNNFLMNPVLAFQNKRLAVKHYSMHGVFKFDDLERKTLEFINDGLIV